LWGDQEINVPIARPTIFLDLKPDATVATFADFSFCVGQNDATMI